METPQSDAVIDHSLTEHLLSAGLAAPGQGEQWTVRPRSSRTLARARGKKQGEFREQRRVSVADQEEEGGDGTRGLSGQMKGLIFPQKRRQPLKCVQEGVHTCLCESQPTAL